MMIFPLVFCSIMLVSASMPAQPAKITAGAMIFPVHHSTCQPGRTDHPRLIHLGEDLNSKWQPRHQATEDAFQHSGHHQKTDPSTRLQLCKRKRAQSTCIRAVIVGFTLIAIGEKGKALLNVIDSCNEVCLKVISTVMYFTPIGVFCTIVPVVGNSTETIISLATQLIITFMWHSSDLPWSFTAAP